MAKFAASGFKIVDAALHGIRVRQCRTCEHRRLGVHALPLLHRQEGLAAARGLPDWKVAGVMLGSRVRFNGSEFAR